MAKSTKKVSINLGTINEESLAKFSSFNQAVFELRKLREIKKADIEKVEAEIVALKEARKEALEKGESIDEVAVKFDILPLTNKLNAIENKFKEDCKPHNLAKKEAMKLIPDSIYHAYLLVQAKGDSSAKGTLVTKRDKKTNEVKETVKVEKTMACLIKEFANTIGLGNSDNESAIDKFAMLMSVRTNGMIKSSKGEEYLKVKSESQYKEIFMLSFLQYAVIDKKVLIKNEDNTLTMRDFSAEA